MLAFAGMLAKHALNGQIIGAVAGGWFIVFLAIKYGTPGWAKLDKFCFIGAIIGIFLWLAFKEPLFGIIVSQAVIFTGSIPTFVSTWEDPSRENKLAWILYWLSCVSTLLSIEKWTMSSATQPITFFVVETIILALILFHKKAKN